MIDIKNIIQESKMESPEFHISNLVCDILVLTDKISKLDKQASYYETVKELRTDSLNDLKNQYLKVKNEYNEISLKQLLLQRKKIQNKLKKVNELKSQAIKKISTSIITRELSIVDDYIKMKSKFPKLKNIKEYSNLELYMFFDI